MSRKPTPEEAEPALDDPDNPEWTEETFARARPPEEVLPPEVLSAFRRHRGPQKAPKKTAISVRLPADLVEDLREAGPGWQSLIEGALRSDLLRRNDAVRFRAGSRLRKSFDVGPDEVGTVTGLVDDGTAAQRVTVTFPRAVLEGVHAAHFERVQRRDREASASRRRAVSAR